MEKETLEYCRELALEIISLEQQIQRQRQKLESRSWPDGAPRSGYVTDRLGDSVAKIADLDTVRGAKEAELTKLRSMIEEAMVALSPAERRLIRLRYFEGLPWEEVADEINYSWRHTLRLNKQILTKMSYNVI